MGNFKPPASTYSVCINPGPLLLDLVLDTNLPLPDLRQKMESVKFVLVLWTDEDTISIEPITSVKSVISTNTLLNKDHIYDVAYTKGRGKSKTYRGKVLECGGE